MAIGGFSGNSFSDLELGRVVFSAGIPFNSNLRGNNGALSRKTIGRFREGSRWTWGFAMTFFTLYEYAEPGVEFHPRRAVARVPECAVRCWFSRATPVSRMGWSRCVGAISGRASVSRSIRLATEGLPYGPDLACSFDAIWSPHQQQQEPALSAQRIGNGNAESGDAVRYVDHSVSPDAWYDGVHFAGRYTVGESGNVTPYVEQYNFTIQRQLMQNLSLDVAYVGNVSRHLEMQRDANSPVYIPGKSD